MGNVHDLKVGEVMEGSKPCKKCKTKITVKKGNGWVSWRCKCRCIITYDSGYLSIVDNDLIEDIDLL